MIKMLEMNSTVTLTPLIDSTGFEYQWIGHADPSGWVPKTLVNLMLTDTPLNTLLNLREYVNNI